MLGYRRNRWFRLSSRELLLIVTIAAIGLAWYADHRRLLSAWKQDHARQTARVQRLKEHFPGWFHWDIREEKYETAEDELVEDRFFK
jgi:hypothetical protein